MTFSGSVDPRLLGLTPQARQARTQAEIRQRIDRLDRLAPPDAVLAGRQPLDANLTAIAALTTTLYGLSFLELVDAAAARTYLALGTAATHAHGDYDLAGAAAAAAASSQPADSDLTALAAIAAANDDLIQRKAGAWTNRTLAQVKTDLAILRADISDLLTSGASFTGTVQGTALFASAAANGPIYIAHTGGSVGNKNALLAIVNGVVSLSRLSDAFAFTSTAWATTLSTGVTNFAAMPTVAGTDLVKTDDTRISPQSPNTQTVDYTLVAADATRTVEINAATAKNVTIPPNSSVAFAVGTEVVICRYGAGAVAVVAGAGVTIRSPGGLLNLTAQYSTVVARKRATDEWVLTGDLS